MSQLLWMSQSALTGMIRKFCIGGELIVSGPEDAVPTSRLGVVVVFIGTVTVVFRVLSAVYYRPNDDAVQLAVSS